nr:hypothetical protein CFP56_72783 [Quercus suber]
MSRTQVLPINDFSDGDGRTPVASRLFREDAYFLARLGDAWAKESGLPRPPGLNYIIDRLPAGYSGWGSRREGSTHVDRYLWGHPNGQFRSINEAFPHFKYLMDRSSAPGIVCGCPRCGTKAAVKSVSKSTQQSTTRNAGDQKLTYRANKQSPSSVKLPRPQQPAHHTQNSSLLQDVRFSSSDDRPGIRGKQVDEDGVADVYRSLIDKLQAAGKDGAIDEPVSEPLSPDAYAGGEKLAKLLQKWQGQQPFLPRAGELVLFVRHLNADDFLRWSPSAKKFRVYHNASEVWADQTVWEAGIISQEPTEPCGEADLGSIPIDKKTSINQSGFKIEPVSAPQRHVYVPLHAIRPLALWQQCVPDANPHPSVIECITTFRSFCIVGKFHFKGTWPNATIFAKALFIGSELIMVGDLVRFLNDFGSVDMLKITSIKLVFLDLDEAGSDDWDSRRPYKIVLHVSGQAYSLEPTRSFDMMGKVPASTNLPTGLPEGQWFHVTDPAKPKMRVEIPYSRVISRYPGDAAIAAWFESPPTPSSSFQPVNTAVKPIADAKSRLSRGVIGTLDGRKFSELHCTQLNRGQGKGWFWADTRVEQLGLKEINDRPVGTNMTTTDGEQTRADLMPLWRSALTTLLGKRGNMEPRRKPKDDEHRSQPSTSGTNSPGLTVRGLKNVTLPRSSTADQDDVHASPTIAAEMQQHIDPASSPTGSKRSHSDMDVDEDVIQKPGTGEKRQPTPPTSQRRIETIEIEDSD